MKTYRYHIIAQFGGFPGGLCELPGVNQAMTAVVFGAIFPSFRIKLEVYE